MLYDLFRVLKNIKIYFRKKQNTIVTNELFAAKEFFFLRNNVMQFKCKFFKTSSAYKSYFSLQQKDEPSC